MNGIITTSQNIEGNIGSCSVIATEAQVGTFKRETIQTNSCTGEVIASYQYVDPVMILIATVLFVLVLSLAKVMFFND